MLAAAPKGDCTFLQVLTEPRPWFGLPQGSRSPKPFQEAGVGVGRKHFDQEAGARPTSGYS